MITEKEKEYGRLWKEQNKEKVREYAKLYSRKRRLTPEWKEFFSQYRRKEEIKLRLNEQARQRRAKARKELLDLLGSKCVKCGLSDWRALQIDHIDGKGWQERNLICGGNPATYRRAILESIEKGIKKYQVLCASCNQIKRYENDEN